MMLNQTVLIQNRFRLSNLFVMGVVYYCRFSLLCCLPHYLLFLFGSIADANETVRSTTGSGDYVLDADSAEMSSNQSWLQAVFFYGFLISIMQFGIAIASFLEGSNEPDISAPSSTNSTRRVGISRGVNRRSHLNCTQLCVYQCLMCCSYYGACFVTRLSVLLLSAFVLGFSSGRCLSLSFDSSATSQTVFQSSTQTHFDRSREILLAIFTFVSLVSGFLYSSPDAANAAEALTSPLRFNAVFVSIIGSMSVVYHCFLPRILHSASRMPFNDGKKIQLDRRSSAGSSSAEESQRQEDEAYDIEATSIIPANFLSTCRGDEKKARTMYSKMLRWRHDHHLETVLTRPQSSAHIFHSILRYYPHFIHGYALDDCAVVYEILGQGDPHRLKEAGVTMDQLVWHFVVRNELVFKLLQERSTQDARTAPADGVLRMMTVLDVKGIGMGSVTADVLSFIGKSGEIIDNYYPEQVKRLVIINTPRWFSTIWMGIARVLPESVRRKVDILSNVSQLDKYIDQSQRPPIYGGTGVDLGKADGHLAFLQLLQDWAVNSERKHIESTPKGSPSAHQTAKVTPQSAGAGHLSSNEKDSTVMTYRVMDISKPQQVKEKGNESSPGNKRKGGGLFGWLVGADKQSNQPNPAFLGSKNQYRFNNATQTWHLDLSLCHENISDSSTQNENLNPSYETELEEQQLVLAIQAAHLASGMGKISNFSTASIQSSERGSPSSSPYHNTNLYGNKFHEMLATESNPNSSPSSNPSTSKPSAHVFLLVCAIYTLTSTIQSAIWTLLPVWLVSSHRSGGVGLSIQDLSLCLSGCALLTLNVHFFFHRQCEQILQSSPLRTLRIGSGLLILILLILHPIHQLISTSLHSNPNPEHHISSSHYLFLPAEHLFIHPTPNPDPNPAADYSFFISISVLASVLAAAVCSGHLVVAAAGGLLQVVLTSSFTSSSAIRLILRAICSIIGSMCAVTGYSAVLGLRLRYPMDSGFFLYISAWVMLSVYVSTVFLAVQFRGDYGLISDSDDILSDIYVEDRAADGAEEGRGMERSYSPLRSARPSSICSTLSGCISGLITAVMTIPGGDLNLLISFLTFASSSSGGGAGIPKRQYFFRKEEFKEL